MNQGLTNLGRQLLGIWQQLGLNQRISIIATGGLVLAGVLALAWWSARTPLSLLYGRLDDAEAARVVAALDEGRVPYEVRAGGSIFVPSDQVHPLRMQLAGKGIPRGDGVGFEIFDKPNFGVSDFVQRHNYIRALQGELSRTIGQLDQVESARVLVVLPENRLLVGNQQKPTASVFVRVRNELPASAVGAIRFLVANAVEGLAPGNVTVVDNGGNVLSDPIDDSVAGLSNNQLSARRNLEQYLARKAEGMLEKVLGQGQAVVRVSADINWDSQTLFEERYDPEAQVMRSSTVDDESTESTTPGQTGGVGVASNLPQETNMVAGAGSVGMSKTKKKTTTNQYEINRTVSSLMQAGGGLERLSAAVFVAQRFQGSGTNRVAAPRTPEELQKLQRIVQSALGIADNTGTGRTDEVILEEMPFNEEPIWELTRQLEVQEQREFWMQLAQRLVLPVAGLVALLLFFRAMRRAQSEMLTPRLPMDEEEELSTGSTMPGRGLTPATAHGHGAGSRTPPGVVTVEVLNQLIRENPASMTQAVRSWMNGGKPNP